MMPRRVSPRLYHVVYRFDPVKPEERELLFNVALTGEAVTRCIRIGASVATNVFFPGSGASARSV